MTPPLALLPLVPLAGAAIALVIRSAAIVRRLPLIVAIVVFGLAVLLAADVVQAGAAGSGPLYADALSAYLLLLVAVVALAAGAYAASDTGMPPPGGRRPEHRAALGLLLLGAVLAAFLADHIVVLWVAFEVAAAAAGFLGESGDRNRRLGIAWGYFAVALSGSALSLTGTLIYYGAGVRAPRDLAEVLGPRWTAASDLAAAMPPETARIALVLVVIGYAIRAGLATFPAWIASADDRLPPADAALRSVALANTALYAVLRFHALGTATLGHATPDRILLGIGMLAVLGATPLVAGRVHLRALLAGSTVHHLGLALFAVGAGGGALAGGLYHLFNHALTRTLLILAAGALRSEASLDPAGDLRGALRRAPSAGLALTMGTLALAGLPPSGLFVSGFLIFSSALSDGPTTAATLVFAAAAAISIALVATAREIVLDAGDSPLPAPTGRRLTPVNVVLLTLTLAIAGLGLGLPRPLHQLVRGAAAVLASAAAPLAANPGAPDEGWR